MPRKIKILDIIPENNENEATNDEIKEVNEPEPIIENNEKTEQEPEKIEQEPKKVPEETKEIKQEVIKETPTEIIQEEQKNVRVQHLVSCPDCNKK